MKKTLLTWAIIGILANGCNEKKANASSVEAAPTQEQESTEVKEITLVEAKGEKIGFTIQIPEGSKELQNDEYGWTYSLVFPDGMNEINVSVHKAVGEINSLEDAVKYTNSGGGQGIKDQKNVGADFLIVKQPTGTVLQEFWYFAKAKEGFVLVKCTAPPAQEAVCMKIVGSLKSL